MAYRPESYFEVLRWCEDTEIAYVPNGKRAGTKSAERYDKYSLAKTVDEALNLGSKVLDLVNDYEKGILKRVGGPVREKPVDLTVEDSLQLTKTDLALARFSYKVGHQQQDDGLGAGAGNSGVGDGAAREGPQAESYEDIKLRAKRALSKASLSKKFGIKVEDLAQGTSWAECPQMIAARSRANVEAESVLDEVARTGRKVSDEDVLRVLRLWAIRRNADRKVVMPEGVRMVHSETVGLLRCKGNEYLATFHCREYPKVMVLFARWLRDNRPEGLDFDWPFTSVIINKGFAAKRHRDHCCNVGPCVVKSFGESGTGGRLLYWQHDDRSRPCEALRDEDAMTLDVSEAPKVIDGQRAHAVEPYTGEERYSLVFFMTRGYADVTPELKAQVEQIEFNWPSPELTEKAKKALKPPKGYAKYRAVPRPVQDAQQEGDGRLAKMLCIGKRELNPEVQAAESAAREAAPPPGDAAAAVGDGAALAAKVHTTPAKKRRGNACSTIGQKDSAGSVVEVVDDAEMGDGFPTPAKKQRQAALMRFGSNATAVKAATLTTTRPSIADVEQAQPSKTEARKCTSIDTTDSTPVSSVQGSALHFPAADLSGKKMQKRVHEKKKHEEERKRAAELLEANSGKFAGVDAEDPEEPDGVDDGEDEALEGEEHVRAVLDAWEPLQDSSLDELSSPTFDAKAAAGRQSGRMPFSVIASVMEVGTPGPKERTVRAIANVFRQVFLQGANVAGDLIAMLDVLLARQTIKLKFVAPAVTAAFDVKKKPAASKASSSTTDLADAALAARSRQRQLFHARRISVAEVAAVLEEHGEPNDGNMATAKSPNPCVEGLTRLLGSSTAQGRETWHLVRALGGQTGLSRLQVFRGLAQAAILTPPNGAPASWPSSATRAAMMVCMEDVVVRAYSQDAGRTERLVHALLSDPAPEAVMAACAPALGSMVLPMRAEGPKSVAAALERMGDCAVLAEYAMRGNRSQVHVHNGGAVVNTFFTSEAGRRVDRVESTIALLSHQLHGVESCILEVIYVRGHKYANKPAEEEPLGDDAAPNQAHQEPVLKGPLHPSTHGTIVVFDLLMLNGHSLLDRPLRERRLELHKILEPSACLKFPISLEVPAGPGAAEEVAKKLDEAVGAMCFASEEEKAHTMADGLVLKRLDGPSAAYVAGKRSSAWQLVEKLPITGPEADRLLFEGLSAEEKALIPSVNEIHFTVVSGFRTRSVEGITDILRIQKLYNDAGVVPTWYVDNECPEEYRKLGLQVVKAGKLIPSRNKALEEAFAVGKACVQTSDDIGSWHLVCDSTRYHTDDGANAAFKRSDKLLVSPVAAARYMLAKMRARGNQCKLGGVYPLSNGGRAMRAEAVHQQHFILGDFFASEVSDIRFDERLTLKEDYDYTASHLQKYGEVLRCNRLIITAKHETNAGGACDARDAEGTKERYNIAILKEKWGTAIADHPTRANQIVLRGKMIKRA